ncbi:M28 family metallopeptidase [Zavarzinella formosa]|uniref:M28 family metallopeptidase n=1 Tax=Zavarzinella formosa TaxID=360055 RepID=UPI0002F32900|nr:M28 family peptidase [Zavarzinella formosa]
MTEQSNFLNDLLTFLCQEPRVAGSVRNAEIAGRLRKLYDQMGYQTDLHEFEFVGWRQLASPTVRYMKPVRRGLEDCLPVVWSKPTNGLVTGKIKAVTGFPAMLRTFEAYDWHVFPVVDKAGSVAACLLSNTVVWPQPLDDEKHPWPCVMVGVNEFKRISGWLRHGVEPAVELSVCAEFLKGQKGCNVIATSGNHPSILVCAHYDSFFTTTGAHDNASGTASLLVLARLLGPNPNREIGFVSFDAEEWNKLGSYRFVEDLRSRRELGRIRAMINIDSVSVGDGICLTMSPGLAGPVRQALLSARERSGMGDGVPSRFHRPTLIREDTSIAAFDTWPFMQAGIPVIQIGTFGEPFPHWHRPEDRLGLIGEHGRKLIEDVSALTKDLLDFWTPGL